MDSGDKAVPKAMSVAFRTALLQALALPTDEPDPDASTYERAAAPKVDVTALMVQVEQLLARAEDLVDAQQVRAYASQGETEALATIKRLTELLASA
jgi:hypothetical protein